MIVGCRGTFDGLVHQGFPRRLKARPREVVPKASGTGCAASRSLPILFAAGHCHYVAELHSRRCRNSQDAQHFRLNSCAL